MITIICAKNYKIIIKFRDT